MAVRCDVDIAQVVATSYAYAKRSVQDLEWITNNVRLLSLWICKVLLAPEHPGLILCFED